MQTCIDNVPHLKKKTKKGKVFVCLRHVETEDQGGHAELRLKDTTRYVNSTSRITSLEPTRSCSTKR